MKKSPVLTHCVSETPELERCMACQRYPIHSFLRAAVSAAYTHTHTHWRQLTSNAILAAGRLTSLNENTVKPQRRLTNTFLFPFVMMISNMKRLLSPLLTSRTDCTWPKRWTDRQNDLVSIYRFPTSLTHSEKYS